MTLIFRGKEERCGASKRVSLVIACVVPIVIGTPATCLGGKDILSDPYKRTFHRQ
jgi:hypothetical protein